MIHSWFVLHIWQCFPHVCEVSLQRGIAFDTWLLHSNNPAIQIVAQVQNFCPIQNVCFLLRKVEYPHSRSFSGTGAHVVRVVETCALSCRSSNCTLNSSEVCLLDANAKFLCSCHISVIV